MVKKNIGIIVLVIVFSLIITFFCYNFQEVIIYSNSGEHAPFGVITKENIVIQELDIREETTIEKIAILFATYNRTESPKVTVEYLKNQKLIKTCEIAPNKLEDNKYYAMNLDCVFDKGDKLQIVIKTDLDTGTDETVTVYITDKESTNKLYRYSESTNEYESIDGELEFQMIRAGFPERVGNGTKDVVFKGLYFLIIMGMVTLVAIFVKEEVRRYS